MCLYKTVFVKAREKKVLMHEMRACTTHLDIEASLYFKDAIPKPARLNLKVQSEGSFEDGTLITCHKMDK